MRPSASWDKFQEKGGHAVPIVSKGKPKNQRKATPPVRIIVASFVLVILLGTLLLTLPIASASHTFTNPLDALFTATSSTCVTGLAVVDTTSHWSTFGHAVILVLIQIGGLGLSTFAIGFSLLVHKRLGIRELVLAKEASGGDMQEVVPLLKLMLGFTFLCEALGAGLLMLRFVPAYGVRGVWPSVFVAVSAYCNAGFDILGFVPGNSSLTAFAGDPLVSLTISLLIAIGGLGFVVVYDIYRCKLAPAFHHKDRERLNFHTQVCLRGTLILLGAGTLLFYIFEFNNTMGHLNVFEKLVAAFFQSVNTRTAGFASVDIQGMNDVTKAVSVALMFIGGCPGSTAGGVKVTTMAVLAATLLCTIRGREEAVMLRHRFATSVVFKSMTVVAFGMALTLIDTGIIGALNPEAPFIDVLYESASAFGTAGLSASLTPQLDAVSHLLLCCTMFIGRVGPLSFGLSILMRQKKPGGSILPEGRMLIG